MNETLLAGEHLGDPDFHIYSVSLEHEGAGWSELRARFASGRDLNQGYHCGVPFLLSANLYFHYRVRGPRGIQPPPLPSGLSPWSELITWP
ncbi:MAG: hypothetical protein AB7S26_19115 [Sandaracinaceae bacterium]